MMHRLLPLAGMFLTATASLAARAPCHASIVFDNGNHVSDGGAAFSNFRAADDFSLATATTLTDVHWKGVYFGNPLSDFFTINIYADNGAGMPTAPGTQIFSQAVGFVSRATTGELVGTSQVYEYSTLINPFLADAGEVYWLEIYNASGSTSQPWYWSSDLNAGTSVETSSSTWSSTTREFTFQLTDDGNSPVPETSSIAIWGIVGGLGFVAGRRMLGRQR